MSGGALGPLIPLPKKYIKNPERIKEYESLENDPVALLAKFKWWSLHDLMSEYHDGLLPKENNANFLKFSVDFSADELLRSNTTDPTIKTNIDRALLPGLQKITSQIQSEMNQIKIDDANRMSQNVTGALTRTAPPAFGGKKGKKTKNNRYNKKGGDTLMNQMMPNQMMPNQPMPNQMMPNQMMPNQMMHPEAQVPAGPLYSAENLEKECLNDLKDFVLTSKSRVFITDGVLPTLQVGGKTRKGRKNKRKIKTRRYQRNRRRHL